MKQLVEQLHESLNWADRRRAVREFFARHTPPVLTCFPFEVMVGVLAVFLGIPAAVGAVAPASMVGVVGVVALRVWAATLVLGGLTVLASLKWPSPQTPQPWIAASGLSLLAGTFAIYAVAVLVNMGASGFATFAIYACVAVLASIRGTHFRRVIDLQRGAHKLQVKQGVAHELD